MAKLLADGWAKAFIEAHGQRHLFPNAIRCFSWVTLCTAGGRRPTPEGCFGVVVMWKGDIGPGSPKPCPGSSSKIWSAVGSPVMPPASLVRLRAARPESVWYPWWPPGGPCRTGRRRGAPPRWRRQRVCPAGRQSPRGAVCIHWMALAMVLIASHQLGVGLGMRASECDHGRRAWQLADPMMSSITHREKLSTMTTPLASVSRLADQGLVEWPPGAPPHWRWRRRSWSWPWWRSLPSPLQPSA